MSGSVPTTEYRTAYGLRLEIHSGSPGLHGARESQGLLIENVRAYHVSR